MKTRLKDLREDHDLTQPMCAQLAHISKNSYIRYENGERVPPFDVIVFFAQYYNVTIDYIAELIPLPRPLYDNRGNTTKSVQIGNVNRSKINIKQ